MFGVLTPDFKQVIFISPAFTKVWGLSTDELYKNPDIFFGAIHKDDRQTVQLALTEKSKLARELALPLFRILRPDNSERWIYSRCYPVLNRHGTLTRIAMISEDISEKRAAEEALRKSENLLEAISNHSPAVICAKDLSGNLTLANQGFRALLNQPEADLVGKNIFDLLPATTAHQLWNNDLRALKTDGPIIVDEKITHYDGTIHDYLSVKFPLNDDQGVPVNMGTISIDVTEHIRTREKLRVYEQIVATSRDFLAFVDSNYVYQAVNNSYVRAFNRAQHEIVGNTIENLLGRDRFLETIKEHFDQCLLGKFVHFQHWLDLPDGEKLYLDVSFCPYFSDKDNVSGVVIDAHDATHMKLVEDELNGHREHLEELVGDRTKALETVNHELESFSYSIAHDLRAPLRSISGFAQILNEDAAKKLSKAQKQYLVRISSAATRMARLIDDILELARISRSRCRVEQVNLSTLGQSILHRLTTEHPERDIAFEIDTDMQDNADTQLMQVMLDNLIGNAWKYTGKMEHARIHFGYKQNGEGRIYYIEDNGAGFDMRYADKLFQPFQRLHKSDEFEGTGIGLATVQRIVQRHGGKIWCEANINKGATFYFTLSS